MSQRIFVNQPAARMTKCKDGATDNEDENAGGSNKAGRVTAHRHHGLRTQRSDGTPACEQTAEPEPQKYRLAEADTGEDFPRLVAGISCK